MTKTEIINTVKKAITLGETVIITPEAMMSVWSQSEIENVPHISANEKINGKLYGLSVKSDETYSPINILGY